MDSVVKLCGDCNLLDDLCSTPKRKKLLTKSSLVAESFFYSIVRTYCCKNCLNESERIDNGNHFILQIPTEE